VNAAAFKFCAILAAALSLTARDKKDVPPPSGVKLNPPPPTPWKNQELPANLTNDLLYILHDRHGLETFRAGDARCNLKRTDGAWEFTLVAKGIEPVQRPEKLKELVDARPNFEVTAILPPDNLELKPGRVIIQKDSFDFTREETLTAFYYFAHETIENVRIELLAVTDEWIEAKVTAVATIYAFSPDTKIALITRFKRDPDLGRSIQ
jgi:hypothetical protein